MSYQRPGWSQDADELAAQMLIHFHEATGIKPREGNVETALIETAARAHADTRMIIGDHTDEAMAAVAGFLGITRIPPGPASATVTIEGAAQTIPADQQLITDDGTIWITNTPITITSGTGTGTVIAAAPGPTSATGLGPARQIGPLIGITNIRIGPIITDGTDIEPLGVYLDRAKAEMQTMSIVPRLPAEYATFARRHAQVAKAIAINNYDGATNRPNQPGHITVVVANAQGTTMDSQVINEIRDLMNAPINRPLGVKVHIVQPRRINVTVAVDITKTTGATSPKETVKTMVQQALAPATWDWAKTKLTALDIARAIDDVAGLDRVNTIKVNNQQSITLATTSQPHAVPIATITVTES